MSVQTIAKSKKHKVVHLFSGKRHHYLVKSVSGEQYGVTVQVSCDCKYQSVQGTPNAGMCSHILATLEKVVGDGRINFNDEKRNP